MAKVGTREVELELPSGRKVVGAFAHRVKTMAPALLVIHEFWGLNDDMHETADRLAGEGYAVLAADLYDGQVATEAERARELMGSLDPARATQTLVEWVDWLRRAAGSNGKVGTIGYCMGGAWSLNVSLATAVDATVIYYGRVEKSAMELKSLKGPVLGHFGRKDTSIPPASVEAFREALSAAGKPHEIHFYEAGHAFARIGGPNHDPESAALAERRTLGFLRKHLA